jgi:uncharacterized protein YdeI (YjbR/CyaY-like superfamily)
MADKKTLYVTTRTEWRDWLKKHGTSEKEIWLIYYKKESGKPRIPYDDAVEEAICYGWIDSLVKRLDDERFAQKFTPRKDRTKWSEVNKTRVRKLLREGKITDAGLAMIDLATIDAPAAPKRPRWEPELSPSLKKTLMANKKAWTFFQTLAPSDRRRAVGWIMVAKQEETRERRLAEAIRVFEKNEKLGLK